MKRIVEDDITMRRYLLGALAPEEQSEVEERLFLDSRYFQYLQMAEDDLIDDYVYEELSPGERERFETHFLSAPDREESLRIARALKKYGATNTDSAIDTHHTVPSKIAFLPFLRAHNPLLRLSLAVAILLIALGGLWLVIRAIRTPGTTEPVQVQLPPTEKEQRVRSDPGQEEERRAETTEGAKREPEQNVGQQNRERPLIAVDSENKAANRDESRGQPRAPSPPIKRAPARVYSFLLLPIGAVREGGEVNKIEIPSDAGVANLQLPLIEDTNYRTYRAALTNQDGSLIRTWTGLKPRTAESGKTVVIRVPVQLLRQQKYQVMLSGMTAEGDAREISTYSFQVAKK